MGFREGYLHLHTFKLPAAKKDTVSTVQFPKRDGASDLDLLAGRGKNPSIPIFESFFGGNWNRQKGKDGISAKGSQGRRRSGGTFHFYPRYPTSRDQKQRQRTELSRPSSGTFDLNELHIWVISAMKLSVRSLLIDR